MNFTRCLGIADNGNQGCGVTSTISCCVVAVQECVFLPSTPDIIEKDIRCSAVEVRSSVCLKSCNRVHQESLIKVQFTIKQKSLRNVLYPSCWQTTFALLPHQVVSQMPPQKPFWQNSTCPSISDIPPTSLTSPSVKHLSWHSTAAPPPREHDELLLTLQFKTPFSAPVQLMETTGT